MAILVTVRTPHSADNPRTLASTQPVPRAIVVTGLLVCVAAMLWKLVNDLAAGLAMVGLAMAGGAAAPTTPDEMLLVMRADVAGIAYFTALVPMVGICALGAWRLGIPLRTAFGLQPPVLRIALVAIPGGLVVGVFPAWIAQAMIELVPSLENNALAIVGGLLTEGPLLGRVLMISAVTFGAPLLEELLFRGFLWNLVERLGGPMAALGVTSIAFAAFHLDVVQSAALVITALFFGWLRYTSGSLWPAVIAHFANNALGVGVLVLVDQPTGEPGQLPFLAAASALLVTVMVAMVAAAFRRPA
jgi:membrane protease YdiL (CAAX protease family)